MNRPSRIYLSPPHVFGRERELVAEAFDSNWIAPLGPQVDAFEHEFGRAVGLPYATALSSGTAALHLAMILAGVRQGDEVICSTLTFSATANAISYCGGRPVFIDAEEQSWNMDPGLLSEELSAASLRGRMPKAVVTVDLYGQCADYGRIVPICRDAGVTLIEDAAEALGATCMRTPAGAFGEMAAFSFNGNKIITTSGGGMLVSNSEELIQRARFLATQARDPAAHYEHSVIGYNYRMSNILAAIGRGQLATLSRRVAARRANFAAYQEMLEGLPGLAFAPEAPWGFCTRWLTVITVDPRAFGATREDIRLALEAENIEARPVWKPMHLQPVFRDCRMVGGVVSERIFEHGLCLPSGTNLTADDRGRVVSVIRRLCRSR